MKITQTHDDTKQKFESISIKNGQIVIRMPQYEVSSFKKLDINEMQCKYIFAEIKGNEAYIERSKARGCTGSYETGDGFAINFKSHAHKMDFIKFFDIDMNDTLLSGPKQQCALYFKPNSLNIGKTIIPIDDKVKDVIESARECPGFNLFEAGQVKAFVKEYLDTITKLTTSKYPNLLKNQRASKLVKEAISKDLEDLKKTFPAEDIEFIYIIVNGKLEVSSQYAKLVDDQVKHLIDDANLFGDNTLAPKYLAMDFAENFLKGIKILTTNKYKNLLNDPHAAQLVKEAINNRSQQIKVEFEKYEIKDGKFIILSQAGESSMDWKSYESTVSHNDCGLVFTYGSETIAGKVSQKLDAQCPGLAKQSGNQLYIKNSSGMGDTGAFKGKDGEVAINFPDMSVRKIFEEIIGLNISTITHHVSSNALYFARQTDVDEFENTLTFNFGDYLKLTGDMDFAE